MVTAIKFRNVGPEKEKEDKINKYSAKTFVEINTAQTEVDKDHLDFIKYDILEDTSSRALAAKVLLELNQRDNSVKGLFKTHQTGLGIISPRMIITGIKILTNTNKIERLQDADAGSKLQNKNGYESILDADIRELTNPQILITKSVIAHERLFDTSRRTFYSDWLNREGRGTSYTSLAYTKVFHGIVKLMWYFVSEGHSWNDIEEDLGNIKGNLQDLTRTDFPVSPYSWKQDTECLLTENNFKIKEPGRVFNPAHESIPTQRQTKGEVYDFFKSNLSEPTSIKTIVRQRLLDKL